MKPLLIDIEKVRASAGALRDVRAILALLDDRGQRDRPPEAAAVGEVRDVRHPDGLILVEVPGNARRAGKTF